MKYGIRECADVVLRAKHAQKIGNKVFYKDEPVCYFDTLKTSSLEGSATTVYAQGGRGNSRLMSWDGERNITFTMEDALISPEGLAILTGAGLISASEDKEVVRHVTKTISKEDFTKDASINTNQLTIEFRALFHHNNHKDENNNPLQDDNRQGRYPTSLDDAKEGHLYRVDNNYYYLIKEPEVKTGYSATMLSTGISKYVDNWVSEDSLIFVSATDIDKIVSWGGNENTPPTLTGVSSITDQDTTGIYNKLVSQLKKLMIEAIQNSVTNISGGLSAAEIANIKTDTSDSIYLFGCDSHGEVITEPYVMVVSNGSLKFKGRINTVAGSIAYSDDRVVMYKLDYYVKHISGAFQIDIEPDKFGGSFYLEASTLWRDLAGQDHPAEFIIPNCRVQSNFTFTMASSGDPSSFTFTLDAFPDYTRWDKTKKVLAQIQVFDDLGGSSEPAREETWSNDVFDEDGNWIGPGS